MKNGHYFVLLSQYNQWMNENLYRAGQTLTAEQLNHDGGAFFGSILSTLNHIMVADIFWLKRFTQHPSQFAALQPIQALPLPTALDQMLHSTLENWWQARTELDSAISGFCEALTTNDLTHTLHYTNRKGEGFCKEFGALVLHMFNHQTHHRGQASTLFHQMGVDIGATDLPIIIPNAEENHG